MTLTTTLGTALKTKVLKIKDFEVNFELLDCANQERYQNLAPMYFRGSHGGLVIFDAHDPNSIAEVKLWSELLSNDVPPQVQIVILANKISKKQMENFEEILEICRSNNWILQDISTETGTNVQEIFEMVGLNLLWRNGHLRNNETICEKFNYCTVM